MKKSFIIICLMSFCIGTTLQAQDNSTKPPFRIFEFGARLMPTYSSFNMKTSSGGAVAGTVTLGFGAGAFLGVNFNKHVGVQAEMIYYSISQKYTDNSVDRKITLNYLNIPLLLSLNTDKSKRINLNVVAGPQIGISMGGSLKTTGGSDTANTQAVLAVRKGDLGLAYGAGLDFALNKSNTVRLGLGYRGVMGLFDISNNSQTNSTNSYYILDKTHIKTNSVYIGLSILF